MTPTLEVGTISCSEDRGRMMTRTVSSLYTSPSLSTALAVTVVEPRVRLVTTPSSLVLAR